MLLWGNTHKRTDSLGITKSAFIPFCRHVQPKWIFMFVTTVERVIWDLTKYLKATIVKKSENVFLFARFSIFNGVCSTSERDR